MHAAQVTKWGEEPHLVDLAKPEIPAADSDDIQLKVIASGVSRFVRSRAAGKHYTSGSPPHVPGADGVGRTEDGQLVYFMSQGVTGAMAEYINLPKRNTRPLPEGADPVQIAGWMNPGMASWMAMQSRTNNLPENFTVLVIGATTMSGTAAISFARTLGAGKVIGAARSNMQDLGLDETIQLTDSTDFATLGDIDVVLDFLYGAPALQFFNTFRSQRPTQYVQIGSLAGLDTPLPAAVLRAKNLTIRGSGPGAWRMMELAQEIPGLLNAVAKLPSFPFVVRQLEDVEDAWKDEKARIVISLE
ncbi:hypothetical protein M8818_000610 [Zalaria obscura]|uniref:Uncharacterized protein n=1 Tax=Zalaria obscura TaxID=2024903 RepID=A0ACC3SLQ7_9PEZI